MCRTVLPYTFPAEWPLEQLGVQQFQPFVTLHLLPLSLQRRLLLPLCDSRLDGTPTVGSTLLLETTLDTPNVTLLGAPE